MWNNDFSLNMMCRAGEGQEKSEADLTLKTASFVWSAGILAVLVLIAFGINLAI